MIIEAFVICSKFSGTIAPEKHPVMWGESPFHFTCKIRGWPTTLVYSNSD